MTLVPNVATAAAPIVRTLVVTHVRHALQHAVVATGACSPYFAAIWETRIVATCFTLQSVGASSAVCARAWTGIRLSEIACRSIRNQLATANGMVVQMASVT